MVSAHELNEMHGKKQFSLEQLHFLRLLTESPLTFASMLVVDLYSLPVFEHHRATAIAKLRNRSFQERIKRKALENMDEIGDGEKEEIILAHGIVSRKIADAEKRGVIPIGISGLRREKKLLGSIDAPELIQKLPEPKDVLEQLAQRLEKAKHLKDVSRRTEAQERPDAYRFAEHLTTPPRQEELTRYKAFLDMVENTAAATILRGHGIQRFVREGLIARIEFPNASRENIDEIRKFLQQEHIKKLLGRR